jgi:glucosylceramidase
MAAVLLMSCAALATSAFAATPAVAATHTPPAHTPPAHKPATRKPILLGPKVDLVVTSANLRQALTARPPLQSTTAAPGKQTPLIDVSEKLRYQTIKGVGGAMTDSSAWLLFNELNGGTRAWLLRKLFGAGGIRLRFIKVPIGASDFTATGVPYSYDDLPAGQTDPTLADFSIAHDLAYIVPALRQALEDARHAFVLATPWSPPAWMKTNGILGNPANDLGWLKQADYGPMAQYIVKFLRGYAAAGVQVDAITPQNEPGQQTSYPGSSMSESNEAMFVDGWLNPALAAAHLNTQIYGYDFSWWAPATGFAWQLAGSPAAPDLAGLASHCYFGSPAWLTALHYRYPALDQVVSECAMGTMPFSTSELEIASMRNWASAVALWNLALDQGGGPVQVPNSGCNGCTGIVTINETTHRVTFTRDYYQLGQVSKFLEPGAVRIGSNNFVTYRYVPTGVDVQSNFATPGLDDVAFQNPDSSRVLVAYNSATTPVKFAVRNDGYYFVYTLSPGATATFVWKPLPGSGPPH